MALNSNNNFLQSNFWRKFQEAVGHKTFAIKEGNFSASIIEHELPIVGKYFYCPRGPIIGISNDQIPISPAAAGSRQGGDNQIQNSKSQIDLLVGLAKKNNAGWIRIEPENEGALGIIKKNIDCKIIQAPHDMQPKEILVVDITKTEEELLSGMKPKTRYNIKLAEKKNVSIHVIPAQAMSTVRQAGIQDADFLDSGSGAGMTKKYISEFVRLVKITTKRNRIISHPENYYRKMVEIIPSNILKLYVAKYDNKVIAANLMIFYANTATYLHGASDDEYRNVMAPYFLQWQAILDAKKAGCKFYDFGGISTNYESNTNVRITNKWSGITKFKTGFAPATESIKFPGSFDLVIKVPQYLLYRFSSQVKRYF